MPTLPLSSLCSIEYPIKPQIGVNKVVYFTADGLPRVSGETATVVYKKAIQITFNVYILNTDFFDVITDNVEFTINIPGTDIFLDGNESNDVKLIEPWRAVRTKSNFYRVTLMVMQT